MAQRSKELDVFGAPWQIITEYWTENYLNRGMGKMGT